VPEDFPVDGVEATLLLVVSNIATATGFYTNVLGASLYREYGGDSAVLNFQGMWLLLVTGGGPTPGKPTVTFATPADPDRVDHQLTLRVPDCRAAYDTLRKRGAVFLAPPVDRGGEIRAFFRDPDGHLLEISEVN
jgi:catechol 2,3-dioxygenase-like lactoylglutathione lyase family enzyme